MVKVCFLSVIVMLTAGMDAGEIKSSRLVGGNAPETLTLDVTGEKVLVLTADVGGDTYDYDQAIWGEPTFFKTDGSSVRLTALKPESVQVGWGKLITDKNHTGVALKVKDQTFAFGLWAHAPSRLVYALPPDAVRFEVKVGIDATAKNNGSVVFHITTRDPAPFEALLAAYAEIDPEALLRLKRERAARIGDSAQREAFLKAVDELLALYVEVGSPDALSKKPDSDAVFKQVNPILARYRRLMIDENPAVDFDELLFIRRAGRSGLSSNWQSNSVMHKTGYDNALCRLSIRRADSTPEELHRPPNGAFIGDVDLHWDAGKLLFSSIGSANAWHIFEFDLATGQPRQVTQPNEPDINHYDACYLPDGRIILTCTALTYAVPCVNGSAPVANLFRCNADGSALEALANDQEHAWNPMIMPDGRVLYHRWEYADIPHANSRLLFTCNPDGTAQRALYGSNSFWPNSFFYPRTLPGDTSRVVAIASGHHGVQRMGELVLFDISRGRQEAQGAVQRIPGYGKPVEPIVRDQLVNNSWPKTLHPYPLDADNFLVAMKATPSSDWVLTLIDRFDNRITLHREPGVFLFEPIPLRKEKTPPVLPDKVIPGDPEATLYIADIYQGPGLKGIPKGTVKNLRLYTYTYGFYGQGGLYGSIGVDGPWDMRRILGTVPVNPDGSALFKVPANTPIAIQPLDAENKALQIMRSWVTARNGEYLSCVGCHEDTPYTPVRAAPMPQMKPARIQPWRGPVRNYTFAREVQPVLDRYCAGCHDGTTPDAPYLKGDRMVKGWKTSMHGRAPNGLLGKFSEAYVNLHRYVRHPGIESDIHLQPPMEWHADTTELMLLLQKGHYGVRLDDEAMDRLVTWIDLNAPYHGRWQDIVGEAALRREAVREKRRERYFAISENHEADPLPPLTETAFIPPKPEKAPSAAPLTLNGWPFDPASKPREKEQILDLGEGETLTFRHIPGGAFIMGSETGFSDERPRTVQEIAGFHMVEKEITNAQFRRFNPRHHSFREDRHGYQFGITGYDVNGDDLPAARVTWREAQAFCDWLSRETGKKCRLPTEAEWEYAARAGSAAPFHWGGADADFSAWANLADITLHRFSANPYVQDPAKAPYNNPGNLCDNWIPQIGTVNDGGFLSEKSGKWKPNPWGLYDMHGNVAEWTLSKEAPYPYAASDGRNDPAPGEEKRIVRGGSWYDRPKLATASFRRAYREYQPVYNVGFRVIIEE